PTLGLLRRPGDPGFAVARLSSIWFGGQLGGGGVAGGGRPPAGPAGDGAAVVAVGVGRPDLVVVGLQNGCQRVPGIGGRWRDADAVGPERDHEHLVALALIGLPGGAL